MPTKLGRRGDTIWQAWRHISIDMMRILDSRPDKDHPSRQLGEQKEEEGRGRGGRKTSQNGQVWTSQRHKGWQTRGSEVIGGTRTTVRVKGLIMMMMMMMAFV